MNDFRFPSNGKVYMKKNFDITKPLYSEHILPVPWHFVISRFHCIRLGGVKVQRKIDPFLSAS